MTDVKKDIWDVDPETLTQLFERVPKVWSQIRAHPSRWDRYDEEVQKILGVTVQPRKSKVPPWLGTTLSALLASGLMVYLYKKYARTTVIQHLPQSPSSQLPSPQKKAAADETLTALQQPSPPPSPQNRPPQSVSERRKSPERRLPSPPQSPSEKRPRSAEPSPRLSPESRPISPRPHPISPTPPDAVGQVANALQLELSPLLASYTEFRALNQRLLEKEGEYQRRLDGYQEANQQVARLVKKERSKSEHAAWDQALAHRREVRSVLNATQNELWALWKDAMGQYGTWSTSIETLRKLSTSPVLPEDEKKEKHVDSWDRLVDTLAHLPENDVVRRTSVLRALVELLLDQWPSEQEQLWQRFVSWVKSVNAWEDDFFRHLPAKVQTAPKREAVTNNLALAQDLSPDQIGSFVDGFVPLSMLDQPLPPIPPPQSAPPQTQPTITSTSSQEQRRREAEERAALEREQRAREWSARRKEKALRLQQEEEQRQQQRKQEEQRELKERRQSQLFDASDLESTLQESQGDDALRQDVCAYAYQLTSYFEAKARYPLTGWENWPRYENQVEQYEYDYVVSLLPPEKQTVVLKTDSFRHLQPHNINHQPFGEVLSSAERRATQLLHQHQNQFIYVLVTYCSFRQQRPYQTEWEVQLLNQLGWTEQYTLRNLIAPFKDIVPVRFDHLADDLKKLFLGDLTAILEEAVVDTELDQRTVQTQFSWICTRYQQLRQTLLGTSSELVSIWSQVDQFMKENTLKRISDVEYATRRTGLYAKLETYEALKATEQDFQQRLVSLLQRLRLGYIYAEYTVIVLRHLYNLIIEECGYRYQASGANAKEREKRRKEFQPLKMGIFRNSPCRDDVKLYQTLKKEIINHEINTNESTRVGYQLGRLA